MDVEDEEICNSVYEKIGHVKDIVDIGCGDGYLVNCLASKLDEDVLGCDISNEGFDKAYSRCKEFGTCSSIDCIKVDAHNISEIFPKDKFDVTTFIYSLHHMDRPMEVLKEARKILKERGKLVIGDYWFTERKEKRGCYRFTPKEIKDMIKEAGLKYLGQDRIGDEFTILMGEK